MWQSKPSASCGANAGDFLVGKVGQAKAAGKAKVTASTIHGRALPRKAMSPPINGVDTFIQGLGANQRATLLDIQKDRVADQTITVHATAVLDLFLAHCAVEISRAKQANKQRHAAETAAAAGQASLPEGENTA